MPQYALGLDFGTNSARALVVDCSDGTEVGEAVANYVHGDEGVITDPTDPNVARQEPWDYFDAMHRVVSEAVGSARQTSQFEPSMLVGIGTDTTGSTPMPTKHDGMPLTREPQFENN